CAGRLFLSFLRARRGVAQFWRLHRLHGCKCGGICSVLSARGAEICLANGLAPAGVWNLRLHFPVAQPAGEKTRSLLVGCRAHLRSMEDVGLPQDDLLRDTCRIESRRFVKAPPLQFGTQTPDDSASSGGPSVKRHSGKSSPITMRDVA